MSTFRYPLDNGAVLEFRDIDWTKAGRCYCQVVAFAPDESILANSRCEMSDARSRYAVAQELAGHNGAQPDFWRDALLEAFSALDDDRRGGRESRSFTFYTAADITTNAPVEPQWAVKPWLPLGGITELDGKVKSSGKTTFTLAMCRQILDGAPFLGIPQ